MLKFLFAADWQHTEPRGPSSTVSRMLCVWT